MKLVLLSVAGSKEPWVEEAVASYQQKLRHFVDFEDIQLKAEKLGRDQEPIKKIKDSTKLLQWLSPQDHVVGLTEEGHHFRDSIQFSKELTLTLQRSQRVVLLVGGPFGLSTEAKKRCATLWSLGPLTMSHLVARVVLCEQIYRAFMIYHGRAYHNA